jgi:hypothetical protein
MKVVCYLCTLSATFEIIIQHWISLSLSHTHTQSISWMGSKPTVEWDEPKHPCRQVQFPHLVERMALNAQRTWIKASPQLNSSEVQQLNFINAIFLFKKHFHKWKCASEPSIMGFPLPVFLVETKTYICKDYLVIKSVTKHCPTCT